jgi:hypothetical protein
MACIKAVSWARRGEERPRGQRGETTREASGADAYMADKERDLLAQYQAGGARRPASGASAEGDGDPALRERAIHQQPDDPPGGEGGVKLGEKLTRGCGC